MLGLRAGFCFGFVAGATIASLFSESERAAAPAGAREAVKEAEGGVGRLRALLRAAMAAAREAARAKEREMRRQLEIATRRR